MNDHSHHIRAFIAILLPEEVKAFLNDLQKGLMLSGIKASWPKPATMHLTLKFLGNVKIDQMEGMKTCMQEAVAKIPVHTLSASGLGVFPSVKKARVIWSGASGQTEILGKLAARLDKGLSEKLGVEMENKKYSPHLTIARLKKPVLPKKMVRILSEFQKRHSEEFTVNEINLFESELLSSGAVHRLLFSVPLEG